MNNPAHLLSSLGVLASFSISKKVTKEDIDKITRKVKKLVREDDPVKFKKMLMESIIDNVKKTVENGPPPGLIFPKQSRKKQKLDKFYMELSAVANIVANKFIEQGFSKFQVCFIINAIVNILGINESDFEKFNAKYAEYRESLNDESDEEDDDE